ncbi:hypothetical protein LZ30DRAFT_412411 [Colletotrichum cereale]|nr:hypothetical protein LZ30DRAFT_412411 [Colletotrichum cereale]
MSDTRSFILGGGGFLPFPTLFCPLLLSAGITVLRHDGACLMYRKKVEGAGRAPSALSLPLSGSAFDLCRGSGLLHFLYIPRHVVLGGLALSPCRAIPSSWWVLLGRPPKWLSIADVVKDKSGHFPGTAFQALLCAGLRTMYSVCYAVSVRRDGPKRTLFF